MSNIRLNPKIRDLLLGLISAPVDGGLDGLVLQDTCHELLIFVIENCPKFRDEAELYYPEEFKMLYPEHYTGAYEDL